MTQPLNNSTPRRTEDVFTDPSMPTATTSPGATAAQRELDVDALTAPDPRLRAFLRNASPVAATPAATSAATTRTPAQEALDARTQGFSGPYTFGGQQVSSSPQFRMIGGYNDVAAGMREADPKYNIDLTQTDHSAELSKIAARAGVNPEPARKGYPTATELVKLTQALIDAGKLPSGNGDVAARIKKMQWEWGIGIDCTDYAVIGAAKAVGATVRPTPGIDYLDHAETNPHLARVSPTEAQPGDVFRLERKDGEVGHRAVVYSRKECDPPPRRASADSTGPARRTS
jgi:hypothetical protein